MFYKDLGLADLVNLEEWQKVQDSFSDVLEISMLTVSLEGTPLTNISRQNRYCSEILPRIPGIEHFYGNDLKQDTHKNLLEAIQYGGNIKYPFGVDLVVVPIEAVGRRIVAYVVLGPLILKSRKTHSEYAQETQKYGIDLDELTDVLIEINVFSYNKIYSMINLIKGIFSHMAQTGYHKKRLAEIRPEVVEMDPLFSRYYEEKILSALLHSCALALNADSGSIMTLDKKTGMLHIKVASKLDKDIVNNTNIKVGEGIAGIAAATSKPIILPKDKNKSALSARMKRRYIKSSMIMPFNKGNTHDVYGVINLNIVRKNKDFSAKDISIVKELVDMASLALIPVHQSAT